MSLPLLDEHLKTLHLPTVLANYRRLAKDDTAKMRYLEDVIAMETAQRQENGNKSRIAAARFPVIKTIDAFDFSRQPKIAKTKIFELLDCRFIGEKSNVVFLGPPGVGKTHLASAIGFAACSHGIRTMFTTAADLLMTLIAAKREDRLKQRLQTIDRIGLLIIDELGYIPFEREATDLLFQVISRRYERGSIIITTNLDFPNWTTVFPDATAASAVVDRIVHHAAVFELGGISHRLSARSKSGKTTTSA